MRRTATLVLLLAVAVTLGAAADAGAVSPLLGQWPLDSSHAVDSNDVTDDISGNGLGLTSPSGTMQFGTASPKFGGYLTNATTGTPQITSPLLAPQQVTLLSWMKQSGDPGVLKYIAGRGDDGYPTCSGSSYALYTGYAALPGLHFYVRTPTQPVVSDAPATGSVFDGQWHLVAGTFDGSYVRLYVDGVPVGTPKPAPDGISYSLGGGGGSSFYIDRYPVDMCGLSSWPGQLDEVRVYDRALTQTELQRLAAATGPTAPDLVPDPAPPPPPPAPAPTPAPPGPHDHTLLGAVTYEPSYAVGDDLDAVLSPFAAKPSPSQITVTLIDADDAAIASRVITAASVAGSPYTPALYRFDGLGACTGCTVLLSDSKGIQDRAAVSFDADAGQTDADLVYGHLNGTSITGTVISPTSIRPAAFRVRITSGKSLLGDTGRVRGDCSSARETSSCPAAARYSYRLTGVAQSTKTLTAELDQQTSAGKFVAVDAVDFTLDPSGATVAPDLTALANPPPATSGRSVTGQLNAVAPFGPGTLTKADLDAPAKLLRDAVVELRSGSGALIKKVRQFREGSSSGFTSYTLSGLDPCTDCRARLVVNGDVVDTVPVTVPSRSPSVTVADLDFRDGTPAFVNGVVQTTAHSFPALNVAVLDPTSKKVLASTPGTAKDDGAGRSVAATKLPYRLSGAPAGALVLLALRSRSTILDSETITLSPLGQETQAPVLNVPGVGSGASRVVQGTVYSAGPFGPGMLAATVTSKLTVVLLAGNGTVLGKASIGRGKGDGKDDYGYAFPVPGDPCDDCSVELRSGTTLEDRAPVATGPQDASVTVADLGAGAISGGAYLQGTLTVRHGGSVTGVTVQVRSSAGKVLADSTKIAGDTKGPTQAHAAYRLGGIPRDAGTVTVVVLGGKQQLASEKVAIPATGDATAPDLQIDAPSNGSRV